MPHPSLALPKHVSRHESCQDGLQRNLFYGSIVLARRNAAAMRPHPPTSACNSTKAPSSRLSQIWNPSQSVLFSGRGNVMTIMMEGIGAGGRPRWKRRGAKACLNFVALSVCSTTKCLVLESVVYWYSFSNPRTKCIHCDNCLVISDSFVIHCDNCLVIPS